MTVEEILKFGLGVFNNEGDKFERWLDKDNISINGRKPRILLLSDKGCKEVLDCLIRIEYSNFT